MKKILMPTDFSPIADHALQFAIEIAAVCQSEIFLFHVYHINKIDYDPNFAKDKQPFANQVERSMNQTKRKFRQVMEEKGLTVHTKVEEATIFSLFNRIAPELGIDLIVMGSQGASGLSRIVFGSVAATAMEIAEAPVLVVPYKAKFQQISHIVLAVDRKEISPEALLPLQELALAFGADVTLLNVSTATDQHIFQKIDVTLEGVHTNYKEVPLSKSINDTINEYCEKEGCDLLCMIRREKGFFESLFQKSITKTQVYNSPTPLLVLPHA